MADIPSSMQSIFWSQSVENLDFDKDRSYIIHQTLRYGNLEHIAWLKKQYSSSELEQTFLQKPTKVYNPSSLNFVKNYVLDLENQDIDESKYLKSSPRNI